MKKYGQNGQVPLFAKIYSVLLLFRKYLTIYHSFRIRVMKIKFAVKLEFHKNKSLVNKTWALQAQVLQKIEPNFNVNKAWISSIGKCKDLASVVGECKSLTLPCV